MKLAAVPTALIALVALTAPAVSRAAELKPETLKAWDAYIQAAEARIKCRLEARRPFLWADEQPGRAARLRQGDVLVAPVAGHGAQSVPDGLIHDWIGAVFVPGATLDEVLGVVHDYGRYKDFYKPVVVDSKSLGCSGEDRQFSMRWLHKVLFVTAALDSRYESRDYRVDARRWYSVAATTSVREVRNYGQPDELDLPAGTGSGFIWRLSSMARYEQRDGGVYVELEAIGLTRDIPFSVRWLVNPVVARLSRNSVITSLEQTRDAVRVAEPASDAAVACAYPNARTAGN